MKSSENLVGGQPTDPKAPVHPAPLTLARVPFRGGFIEAAQLEGEVFVPLRPLCDRLGVSLQGQLAKLRGKPWATIKMILTVADDDKTREMVCLSLRSLPLWLATIDTAKVKPEVRPALLALQVEAAEVLYRHFLAPSVDPDALARLTADLDLLREEVRLLRDRRRTRKSTQLGMNSRLNTEDAARVRAYCEARPVVATPDVMREALGLTTWTNVEVSALAAELRELGYERHRTFLTKGHYGWRWRRDRSPLLALVPFRLDAPNPLSRRA